MAFVYFLLLAMLINVLDSSVILPDSGSQEHNISESTIRLVRGNNGPATLEGRLEVWYGNEWGTVCDDLFGVSEASLVCRLMGYQFGGEPLATNIHGRGSGPIHLNMLDCPWDAESLDSCSHNGWGRHFCTHDEDVMIKCRTSIPADIPVRLVGGSGPHEGRLQILHDDQWGTVLNDNWNPRDAAVICRQLGYNLGGEALLWTGYQFGARSPGPVWLNGLNCGGKEPRLQYCPYINWLDTGNNPSRRYTFRDVSLKCYTQEERDFQVRLIGGSDNSSGVVSIHHNGHWWYICDDWWGNDDATVVCKSLGFGNTTGTALYEQHTLDIPRHSFGWDMVYCPSGVTDLQKCFHRGWGQHTCYFWEIAGVSCEPI